jgi:ribosomal-protein-alanine N-acetyltransferase
MPGLCHIVLTTERLTLRRPELPDAPAIQSLVSERAVAETTALIPHPYPDGGAEAFIRQLQRDAGESRSIEFAMIRRADDRLVGGIVVRQGPTADVGDIGYYVGSPYWGQGYATEAARAAVTFGFERFGFEAFEAGIFFGNRRSARVLEKSGFRKTGETEQEFPVRGGSRRLEVYRLDRTPS